MTYQPTKILTCRRAFLGLEITEKGGLVRVDFLAVTPLVFNQLRIVFAIAGILLFPNRMRPAPHLPITMRMMDLNPAIFDPALRQLRDGIGKPYIPYQSICLVFDR